MLFRIRLIEPAGGFAAGSLVLATDTDRIRAWICHPIDGETFGRIVYRGAYTVEAPKPDRYLPEPFLRETLEQAARLIWPRELGPLPPRRGGPRLHLVGGDASGSPRSAAKGSGAPRPVGGRVRPGRGKRDGTT